jgi:hypothetical protein
VFFRTGRSNGSAALRRRALRLGRAGPSRRPDAANPGAGRGTRRQFATQSGEDLVQIILDGEKQDGGNADQNGRKESDRYNLTHN